MKKRFYKDNIRRNSINISLEHKKVKNIEDYSRKKTTKSSQIMCK